MTPTIPVPPATPLTRTYTEWEYQIIQLPASPYRLSNEPKDCEPHTATDLLNTWGERGWQLMGVLGPHEVILMRPVMWMLNHRAVVGAETPHGE